VLSARELPSALPRSGIDTSPETGTWWRNTISQTTPPLFAVTTWGLDLSNSDQGTGGIGGPQTRTSGETTHSYTYDGNGNVSELVTSTGTVAAHYEYGPFGQTTFQTLGSIAANASLYRFSTRPLVQS